jgi:serine/threonine protein kinase
LNSTTSALINLGFDCVVSNPAPETWRKLMRHGFDTFTNWGRSTELALFSSVPQLAIQYDIPLILWGENPGLQLGDLKTLGKTGYDGNNLRNMNTLSGGALDWITDIHKDSGDLIIENQKYAYVILGFISGETLADKMKREQTFNPYDAKYIITGVLNGLNYLHNLENPIIHNDITNLNVMIDLSGKVEIPKIIDFGYSRYLTQSNKDFLKKGLNPFYQANECFNKVFSVKSDVFAVGELYFHLLIYFHKL